MAGGMSDAGDPDDVQRLGAVRISGELLRDSLFRESRPDTYFRVQRGIPADAEFVRMYVDELHNSLVCVYRHPSFPKTPPGCVLTFVGPPMMEAVYVTRPALEAAWEMDRKAVFGDAVPTGTMTYPAMSDADMDRLRAETFAGHVAPAEVAHVAGLRAKVDELRAMRGLPGVGDGDDDHPIIVNG